MFHLPYPLGMMNSNPGKLRHYKIEIEEHLEQRWREWFDGFTISHNGIGRTTLYGPIQDQAALHGVLRKINNLGLTLISVNPEHLLQDNSQINKEIQT